MQTGLVLLPRPKKMTLTGVEYVMPAEGYIVLKSEHPQALLRSSSRFEAILWKQLGYNWETIACDVPADQVCLTLAIDSAVTPHAQGFLLNIRPDGIEVRARDEAGIFYGVATLIQILRQSGNQLPCLVISDWPDFPSRGVMLDISRDKVYRMETLYDLVDRLAGWKINQLQLYTEHTFAYPAHPVVWQDASPMTGEEILYLDQYCKDRYIELVANQNSFGHMERWLRHAEYAHLAEVHGEFEVPWGTMHGPFSVAPEEPGTAPFIFGLYDQLLPHFTSRMVNVGCDETFDLGYGKSKAACEARGTGAVYLDYLLRLYGNLSQRGKVMQFWGDIILQHPDLVPRLPKDLIALEWGYEADHPFDEHGAAFASSGIPFYVCPGTSAWNTLAGRTDNCLGNLKNASIHGLKHGAVGYLNTDWGDNGHWQVLPVSFLGYSMGAAFAWSSTDAADISVKEAVSRFAFDDPTGVMGAIAYDLGNVYRLAGFEPSNSSALWGLLSMNLEDIAGHPGLKRDALVNCLSAIDEIMERMGDERMDRPDAALVREEFGLTAQLMRHACQRGLLALGGPAAPSRSDLAVELTALVEQYRSIWLKRNRPGGLNDSTARFKAMISEYKS